MTTTAELQPPATEPVSPRRPKLHGWRRALAWAGWALILAGVGILLYVVWQLWGTRIETWGHQDQLRRQFKAATTKAQDLVDAQQQQHDRLLRDLYASVEAAIPSAGPVARIEIPKIGLNAIVVAGTRTDDLKKGPGMMLTQSSGVPGGPGNAVVAGHRVTYGADFNRLDELRPGDEIVITNVTGRTVYQVKNSFVVAANDSAAAISVTGFTRDNRLTLSTCNPKFSARQRLIVVADMVSGPFVDYHIDAPRPFGNELNLPDDHSIVISRH